MQIAGNVMRPFVRPCWPLLYDGWVCTIPVRIKRRFSKAGEWKFEHHYFSYAEYTRLKVNHRRGHDAE